MGSRRVTIAAAASLGLVAAGAGFAGCSQGNETTIQNAAAASQSDASVAAESYFVTAVYPTLESACGSCHSAAGPGSTFLTGDARSTYVLIADSVGLIADPSRSPLVQHIHTNPAIVVTAQERNLLSQWLGIEVTARGLQGATVAATSPTDAYNQFAACMNFETWEYYGVGNLAFAQTDTNGPCLGCHSVGQGSAWMSADPQETFNETQQFPFIEKWVVATVDENGNFAGLQPSLRFIEKQDEGCQNPDPTTCHPTYGLAPDVQNAITGFVQTTLQNLIAHTCSNGVVTVFEAGAEDGGDAN